MHDVIAFLKDAVRKGPATVGCSDCYVVDGKMLRANNDVLHAGVDWPSGAKFVLPAQAVDSFLARTTEVKSIKVGESTVEFRTGRLHSTINRRDEEPAPTPVLPDEWLPVPAGFVEYLKVARQFTNDTATGHRLWQTGIRVWAERITACSGAAVIDMELPGLMLDRPKLLGKAAVDFLTRQGDPDEFGVDRHTISFRWDDGRWVRCLTIAGEMPEEIISKLFSERLGTEAATIIDEEWRAAHADAVALGDSSVGISITGMKVMKDSINTNIELAVDVPSDHMSWWPMKELGNVLAVAKAWNPLSYPDPALFLGDGFRGAIVAVIR